MSQSWHEPRRRRPRPDRGQARLRREVRRRALIEAAVAELAEGLTHAEVARRTGIPLGYLEWAYPTLEDLRAECA